MDSKRNGEPRSFRNCFATRYAPKVQTAIAEISGQFERIGIVMCYEIDLGLLMGPTRCLIFHSHSGRQGKYNAINVATTTINATPRTLQTSGLTLGMK